MAERSDRGRDGMERPREGRDARDERVGRGQREGLDGGVSRNAHTSGERMGDPDERNAGRGGEFGASDTGTDQGAGGYGASSGFAGGTRGSEEDDERRTANRQTEGTELEAGATEARTRAGSAGRQAESGLETQPEDGSVVNSDLPAADGRSGEPQNGGRRDPLR